jgi:hypothetical protein
VQLVTFDMLDMFDHAKIEPSDVYAKAENPRSLESRSDVHRVHAGAGARGRRSARAGHRQARLFGESGVRVAGLQHPRHRSRHCQPRQPAQVAEQPRRRGGFGHHSARRAQ